MEGIAISGAVLAAVPNAVMCYGAQRHVCAGGGVRSAEMRLPAGEIRSCSGAKCVFRAMDYRHSSLTFSKNIFVSFRQGYSLKSY